MVWDMHIPHISHLSLSIVETLMKPHLASAKAASLFHQKKVGSSKASTKCQRFCSYSFLLVFQRLSPFQSILTRSPFPKTTSIKKHPFFFNSASKTTSTNIFFASHCEMPFNFRIKQCLRCIGPLSFASPRRPKTPWSLVVGFDSTHPSEKDASVKMSHLPPICGVKIKNI